MRKRLSRMHDENAQGVIEFALVSMILMLIFLGTVDFARFMYYDSAIRSAARVGAEAAGNECTNHFSCAQVGSQFINDEIMQVTQCEASNDGRVVLNPQMNCGTNSSTDSPSDPCPTAGSCTPCQKDICLVRYAPCSGGVGSCDPCTTGSAAVGTIQHNQCIQVIVGYNFKPISPLMNLLFRNMSCWRTPAASVTDSTAHTLCASASARVF